MKLICPTKWSLIIWEYSNSMSTYEEEHNTEPNERSEARQEFHELFSALQDPTDERLIELFRNIISPALQREWMNHREHEDGCTQEFIDSLPRVAKDKIPLEDTCPICYERFGNDEFPLVAKLPHCSHMFDLQCISLWLGKQNTCPICRDKVNDNKIKDIDVTKAELEEDWGMYG